MNRNLALQVMGDVMSWDDERATAEFARLRLMADAKYDDYREYLAGARFIESLAAWLQQFDSADREAAYMFVRTRLVYVSPAELQHLTALAYPEAIQPVLVADAAHALNLPMYRIWATPEARAGYHALRRSSLFFGLSDGARIDAFRRCNQGVISNEQVVMGAEINEAKWDAMLHSLRKDSGNAAARFTHVFLIDDFVGTGTTLLRSIDGAWEGKLVKFWNQTAERSAELFESQFKVVVHHYIASHTAARAIVERDSEARQSRGVEWFANVQFTFGAIFNEDLPVTLERDPAFVGLMKRYYDPGIETDATRVGGDDVRFGFGGAALPLVLEHNTPNNSVALLWAESTDESAPHQMRPLFRRRQRHG